MTTDLFTILNAFFAGVIAIIDTLLIPKTGSVVDWTNMTGVQVLIWFGLVFLFVGPVFGLIIRMVRSGSGSR